jgi:hypothetical protein
MKKMNFMMQMIFEDIAFTEAFMKIDLYDFDKFDASMSSCLEDLFPLASKTEAPEYWKFISNS